MAQPITFVLIEPDSQKASAITGLTPQELIKNIPDSDIRNHVLLGFERNDLKITSSSTLPDFLGCSVEQVIRLGELSPEDFVALGKRQTIPHWICLNTKLKNIANAEYADFIVNNDVCQAGVYLNLPILKRPNDVTRYICFQESKEKSLDVLTSLLMGIDAIYLPVLQYLLTDVPEVVRYWPMHNPHLQNLLPFQFHSYFQDTIYETVIDLDASQAETCLQEEVCATGICHLVYADTTPGVTHNLMVSINRNFSLKEKKPTIWVHRLGGLSPMALESLGAQPDIWREKWDMFLEKWTNHPIDLSAYSDNQLSERNIGYILYTLSESTRSFCDLLHAALSFISLPGNEPACEIAVEAISQEKTLLCMNLLGLYGYLPFLDYDGLSRLLAPEVQTDCRDLYYNDIHIKLRFFHASTSTLDYDNEIIHRLEAYAKLWVAEELQHLSDANLVKFCYSQIMARNMSHNIGSHAVVSFQNQIKDFNQRILSSESIDIKGLSSCLQAVNVALEYFRLKSDYLSTFAFSGTAISFHTITVSEWKKQLEKYTPVFNALPDTNVEVVFQVQVKGKKVSTQNDLKISLPESGELALFNIIESVIRNSVKHEGIGSQSIEFVIDFGSKNDSHPLLGSSEVNVQIYRKGSKYEKMNLTDLNSRINESLIDPYANQLNYRNLGLKEMKGAVLFLLGIPLEEFEMQPQNPLSIYVSNHAHLTACRMSSNKEFGELPEWGYLFQVRKCQDILMVIEPDHDIKTYPSLTKRRSLISNETADRLGIPCADIDRLEEELTRNKNKVLSYSFLVFSAVSQERIIRFLKNVPDNRLPVRKVCLNLNAVKKKALELKVWESYLGGKGVNFDEPEYPCSISELCPTSHNHDLPFEPSFPCGSGSEIQQMPANYKRFYYVEALSSACQKTSPLYNYSYNKGLSEEQKAVCRYVVAEYTTYPVFIIDERIQRKGLDNNLFERWKAMGIFVPEGKPLDGAIFPGKYVEDYLSKIKHPLPGFELSRGRAALILHESLLQRWLGSTKVVEYLGKLKQKQKLSIYLTTGRGKPQYLTEEEHEIRFIPYSVLASTCENLDKYKLCERLLSAHI